MKESFSKVDLHSSMDRFEGQNIKTLDDVKTIYIPVWIDLKLMSSIQVNIFRRYLHSSMDRFEGT